MYGEQKKSESPHRPFYLQNMNSWDASTSRGAVRLQKVGGENIYKPLALEITDIWRPSFKKYLYLVNQCTERVKTIAFDSRI